MRWLDRCKFKELRKKLFQYKFYILPEKFIRRTTMQLKKKLCSELSIQLDIQISSTLRTSRSSVIFKISCKEIGSMFRRRWKSWCFHAQSFCFDVDGKVWSHLAKNCFQFLKLFKVTVNLMNSNTPFKNLLKFFCCDNLYFFQGYCCSFNILKPVGSSVASKPQKIRKTQFFGPDMGLSVVLNPLIEPNAMTVVNSEGMKLMINEFNLYPGDRSLP